MKPELLHKALSLIQSKQLNLLLDEEIALLLDYLVSAQSLEEGRTFSSLINALIKEGARRNAADKAQK